MKIDIMLDEGAIIPFKKRDSDAGFDICYYGHESYIDARSRQFISTGVRINIPNGWFGRISPRSGLARDHGLDVGAGIIDSGYTGEIILCLFNHSDKDYYFEKGDKMAQIIFHEVPKVEFCVVDSFDETDRGSKGFGSSGK